MCDGFQVVLKDGSLQLHGKSKDLNIGKPLAKAPLSQLIDGPRNAREIASAPRDHSSPANAAGRINGVIGCDRGG
jgi:hypothetical protein